VKALVNSTMTATMTFTKTSQKFGQWADHRVNTIYGLGFSSEVELIRVRFVLLYDCFLSMTTEGLCDRYCLCLSLWL